MNGKQRIAAVLVMLLFGTAPALAVVFTVNDMYDAPDANPGDGVALTEDGTTSLRAAIEEANALPGEDTIHFTYPVVEERMGLLFIDSPITICDDLAISASEYAYVSFRIMATATPLYRAFEISSGTSLVMDAIHINDGGPPSGAIFADLGAAMYVHSGSEVRLNGCEIQSGHATVAGGAIYVDHAVLDLAYTQITGTSDGDGGGVYNDHGLVHAQYGGFLEGTAEGRGGAIFNDHGYVVVNQGNEYYQLSGGAASAGGSVYSDGGVLAVNNSPVLQNTAFQGGAFYLSDGARLDMSGCLLIANSATSAGGAVFVESGSVQASLCTFGQNTAGGVGGAVCMAGGDAVFLNCTFKENTAVSLGGGIIVANSGTALCSLGNSIVAEDTCTFASATADISGPIQSLGHNLIGVSDGGSGYLATDLLGTAANPLSPLLTWSTDTPYHPATPRHIYLPQSGSPVIDAGDTALLFRPEFVGNPCYDARLLPRVRNGAVDIGAVEVQAGSTDLTCSGAHSADYDGDGRIGLGELLRVIQLYNSGQFQCYASTEDGFLPGAGDETCAPHSGDYAPQDWSFNLGELLRMIQLYTMGAYHACADGEDGFCPGAA